MVETSLADLVLGGVAIAFAVAAFVSANRAGALARATEKKVRARDAGLDRQADRLDHMTRRVAALEAELGVAGDPDRDREATG